MQFPNSLNKIKAIIKRRNKKTHSAGRLDWGELLHIIINAALPFVLVAFIRNDLTIVALGLVLLSKWRMFAMRYNHLPANIRANLTDLIFKLATFSFMVRVESLTAQVLLAAWYSVWLLMIKPQTGRAWVAVQAMISQAFGVTALMWATAWAPVPFTDTQVLIGIWIVVYGTTYHFISSYDDPLAKVMAKIWAVVAVQMAWIFLHWNLVYFWVIPQYALIQVAFSYLAADMYNSYMNETLKPDKYRTYVFSAVLILVIVLASGKWSGPVL